MTWQDAAQSQQQPSQSSKGNNGAGGGSNTTTSKSASETSASAAQAVPAPILLSPSAHIHLAFDARNQRLQSFTFETLSSNSSSSSSDGASQKLAQEEAEAWYRPTRIWYQGQPVFSSSSSSEDSYAEAGERNQPRLTRSKIQQLLGPTYPGQERVRGDGTQKTTTSTRTIASSSSPASGNNSAAAVEQREFILSYPGVAFSFPLLSPPPSSAADHAKQVQERNVQASTVYVFQGKQPHSSASGVLAAPLSGAPAIRSGGAGSANTNTSEALLDEESWVEDAIIFPGEGVRLLLSHAPATDPTSKAGAAAMAQHRQEIDLQVGQTTVQDVLCEFGAPEGKFLKEEDRMQIHRHQQHYHSGDAGRSSNLAGKEDGESGRNFGSEQTIQGQPFFFNYFSLGLDLYFDPSSSSPTPDEPILRKVILHSNTPGHALFQRYQRAPWRFAQPARDGRHLVTPSRAGDAPLAQKAEQSSAFDYMRSFDELTTFLTSTSAAAATKGSSKAATAGKNSAESTSDNGRETMLLDRSFDPTEFKGLLELDVRSTLHGFPGCVLEVTDRDGRVACITVLS